MAEDKNMARGTAQELFRDNIGSVVDPTIPTLFAENGLDMGVILDPALSAHDLEAANSPARVITAQASTNNLQNHDGVISGNRAGIRSGLAERVADAKESKTARSTRDAERANDTAFYLALMQEGAFDGYIAENVFGGMSDDEVGNLVDEIERTYGGSFEEYAAEILGEDSIAQLPGESDADYQRRLLQEIGEAVLNEDGTIRAGFEDDPVARFIQNHEFYQKSMEAVADREQRLATGQSTIAEVVQETVEAVEANVIHAHTSIYAETEEMAEAAADGEDAHRDTAFAAETGSSWMNQFPGAPDLQADFAAAHDGDVSEIDATNEVIASVNPVFDQPSGIG